MAVTEYELAAVLDHCRSLIDAADQYEHAARERAEKARVAKVHWEGPYRVVFNGRFDDESADLAARVRRFRVEADAWAQVWADTVDRLNQDRQRAAVDRVSSERGFGESFVDVFVGDDSAQQVRDFQPVPVPTAQRRYAATGGLERFD